MCFSDSLCLLAISETLTLAAVFSMPSSVRTPPQTALFSVYCMWHCIEYYIEHLLNFSPYRLSFLRVSPGLCSTLLLQYLSYYLTHSMYTFNIWTN